ncbi:MAG: LamG-like jellyroll fold domain-containing protein, partial [Rubripirellula sp.]
LALDASKRDVCRVKRERTSSPLQALAMLNGPQFVEASRAMSQRLIDQYGSEDRERIGQDMFRLLTSRSANDDELRVIQQLYKDQHQHFLSDIESAVEYLSLGEFGSYPSESSIGGIKWQGNPHDFRLGGSPSGTEKFSGSFGRASLFPSEFSQEQVSRLVAVGFDGDVPDGLKAQMTNRGSQNETQPLDSAKRGHLVFPNTSGLVMQDAFTVEAWVKPEGSRSGRIWDKITPGKGDGFLLDLVGGIRLICGETVFVVDRQLPLNEWSHLACSVNLASGRVNVFLNGELVSKSPKDPPVWTTNDLAVLAAWSSVANTLINLDECVTKR